jgi:zinc transporter 1/2/3
MSHALNYNVGIRHHFICHNYSFSTRYCVDSAGEDVQLLVDGAGGGEETTHTDEHENEHASEEPAGSGEHCHDHAGIP